MFVWYVAAIISYCPDIKVTDKFGDGFTNHDMETLRFAEMRCEEQFPDFPCMHEFIKAGNQNYHVICGKDKL